MEMSKVRNFKDLTTFVPSLTPNFTQKCPKIHLKFDKMTLLILNLV